MYSTSLKSRVILTTVIIVTVVSTLFGIVLVIIKQQLEEATFGNMVRDQLQVLTNLPDPRITIEHPLFKDWKLYISEEVETLPYSISQLSEGAHHSVRIDGRYYHVEVKKWQDHFVYLTYDITDWEEQEHALLEILGYGILIVLIIAVIMSIWASRTILSPVRAFTSRLTDIQPGQRNVRTGKDFQGNEIGQIANAFDRYLTRLDQFVERERSFTEAASHELRTPLSVMMGAVDILDMHSQSDTTDRAVNRIKRACAEMLAFIEATLFLSREKDSAIKQGPTANLKEIINELIDDNRNKIEELNIKLDTDLSASPTINQPKSILQITIGNILRNAIEHSANRSIVVSLTDKQLTVQDTGEGIAKENLPNIFERDYTTKEGGTGLGLNLVRRVCNRFRWDIHVDSKPGCGTTVTLIFTPSNESPLR